MWDGENVTAHGTETVHRRVTVVSDSDLEGPRQRHRHASCLLPPCGMWRAGAKADRGRVVSFTRSSDLRGPSYPPTSNGPMEA